jgi:DNA invertase Pin-like site-specific DNA recombinase
VPRDGTVHDYELVDVIVDAAESGGTLERPGMRRVLQLVNGRQVEAVLIAELDRLTRRVRDPVRPARSVHSA